MKPECTHLWLTVAEKCGEKTARKYYTKKNYLTLNYFMLFLQKFVSEGSVVRDCIDQCTEKGKWNEKLN